MTARRLPLVAVVLLVAAIVAFDVFVLPLAVRLFFGSEKAGSVLPPLAADPPPIVRVLSGSSGPDVQILLKPVRDALDQNAFHDRTINRRVLELGFERWRFYQLIVANFSKSAPFALDLAATPLDVRLVGGPQPVRVHTAEEVLAEAPVGVARSGAAVLAALGRGAGEGDLPPHSLATWLVALPADRVDAAGGLLGGAAFRARPNGDAGVELSPATVRKSVLDDFLVSPSAPLEVVPEAVRLSLLEKPGASGDAAREREYGPR